MSEWKVEEVVVGEHVPRMGNRFSQKLGQILVSMSGWKIEGELPNEKKLMIVIAPHTSNWDFIYCMSFILALRFKLSYMMKKEAFFWPFKGLFMKLGGIPIDRKASNNTVDQVVDWYRSNERMWVAITPEGSRSRREKWKNGFARIAFKAQVPVLVAGFDYPSKTVYLEPLRRMTDDAEYETEQIKQLVRSKYQGKHQDKL